MGLLGITLLITLWLRCDRATLIWAYGEKFGRDKKREPVKAANRKDLSVTQSQVDPRGEGRTLTKPRDLLGGLPSTEPCCFPQPESPTNPNDRYP